MTKMLIVEDQSATLESLEYAVNKVLPKHLGDTQYDVAKCYDEAREKIPAGYDIILLDHRMPMQNVGNLEDTDMHAFSRSLKNVGYSLIPYIKSVNPKTIVIGTSSLDKSELQGEAVPDYIMSKMWGDAEKDLERILTEIRK
jgi:CheY-like chemotaxis protein